MRSAASVVALALARPGTNRPAAAPNPIITTRRPTLQHHKNQTYTTLVAVIAICSIHQNHPVKGGNPIDYCCTCGTGLSTGIINSEPTIFPPFSYRWYSWRWQCSACYPCTLPIVDGSTPPFPTCIDPAPCLPTISCILPHPHRLKNNNKYNCHAHYSPLQ